MLEMLFFFVKHVGSGAWSILRHYGLYVLLPSPVWFPIGYGISSKRHDAHMIADIQASAPLLAGLVGDRGDLGDFERSTDRLCRPGRDGARYITASRTLDERIHTAAPLGSPAGDLKALLSKQGFIATRDIGDGISRMHRARRYGVLQFDEQIWMINWTEDANGLIASLQGCANYWYMGP